MFTAHADGYAGVYGGRAVFVRQNGSHMEIDCPEEDIPYWRRFFDLDSDYDLLPYLSDAYIRACHAAYGGLRLMRQPVWETVCSFIISANNHQSRIEGIMQKIARLHGQEHHICGSAAYGFPSPEALASLPEEALRLCGTGYRAPYLTGTARMIARGHSLNLDDMEYEEAHAHLTAFPGVGEKVADCVLLFASRHQCAFPVDVWMERVMRGLYGLTGSKKQIKEAALRLFGDRAGYVQQLLFHGARTGILTLARTADT